MLVAATGVGSGDLVNASLAGSKLGLVVIWAALAGGLLKWLLNEGLARWQLATGTTLLEGWVERLGAWIQWVFLAYLLIWSFGVGGAMVSGCGIAGAALLPLGDERTSKIIWGIVHSLVGLVLVRVGGYRLFERVMGVCIALMFVTVMATAVLIRPDWSGVLAGTLVPRIPPGGTRYVLSVLGGVGGTVTLLSYGYWIREAGRRGEAGMRPCRIDLAAGYLMTSLFGMAMVIIGSRVDLEGGGDGLALSLAQQLEAAVGPVGRWVFLLGFWGAVFSSLLGVWQSVPYLFADFLLLRRRLPAEERAQIDLTKTRAYRGYMVALAVVPLVLLWQNLADVQLAYGVSGAMFMPLLALTLLLLNNRTAWVGERFRNGWIINAGLIVTLVFFAYTGFDEARVAVVKWMTQ